MQATKNHPQPEKCHTADGTRYLTLHEAAAKLKAGGKRPSVAAVLRWCRKGHGGVRLDHARLGREIFVAPDALAAFGRHLASTPRAR